MNITKVLGSRVLVKVSFAEVKDTTDSGLVVAPQSINPSYFEGVVVLVGPMATSAIATDAGINEGIGVKVGDKVAFTKYGYEDMGDGQYVVEENALICVYE